MTGSCVSTCAYPPTSNPGLVYIDAPTNAARMCEKGCGWAPELSDTATHGAPGPSGSHGKCISGTPDYPSDLTVKVVQWETKGCPKDCGTYNDPSGTIPIGKASGLTEPSPSGDVVNANCCPRYAPKSMCY